jgi:hypothetical protein
VKHHVDLGHALTAEHYLFIMMMANNLIRDDHTSVLVNELKDINVNYAGFLITRRDSAVVVVHSNDARIKVGSVVVGINGESINKYVS